ncbi:MAG: hypothetical protein OXC60_18410, partial [Litoreibacter sp.]|nr:hypothetical protein [Litoreibacter sp.]
MVARTYTVAFEGIDARMVEVQCAVAPGLPSFSIVGLADKAVSEARDRVRSALSALSIAMPSKYPSWSSWFWRPFSLRFDKCVCKLEE